MTSAFVVELNGAITIADGRIEITRSHIVSKKPNGVFEYEYALQPSRAGQPTMGDSDLSEINIALDYMDRDPSFDHIKIGGLSYQTFGKKLRTSLTAQLKEQGATVEFAPGKSN